MEALIEEGRIIRRVPDVVRARALSRARSTMAATTPFVPARPAPMPRVGLRIAVAASVAMVAGAAAAGAALHQRSLVAAANPTTSGPPETRPEDARHAASPLVAESQRTIAQVEKSLRPNRPSTSQESYAAELELLQRAQAAFARGDLAETLAVVARHAHRFPNGRLSEEREAFRIRSLVGSGQTDEGRRAVTAFARRFPRSVLLPRLQATVNAVN